MARGLVGGSRTQSGRERWDEGGAASLEQDWNLDLPRGGDMEAARGGKEWRGGREERETGKVDSYFGQQEISKADH